MLKTQICVTRPQCVNNSNTNEDIATKQTHTHTTDTFLFISHTTNVILFKFRCNIFIGVRIIKEMPGLVCSGTPCTLLHIKIQSRSPKEKFISFHQYMLLLHQNHKTKKKRNFITLTSVTLQQYSTCFHMSPPPSPPPPTVPANGRKTELDCT